MKAKEDAIEVFKRNSIELAKDHRKRCKGACSINLILLMEMAKSAGVRFNEDEVRYFL